MHKKLLLVGAALILAIGASVAVAYASRDASYTSWERMQTDVASKTMYIRFRINIPYTIEYIKRRITETEAAIRTTTDPDRQSMLRRNWTNYTYSLGRMQSGKPLLGIYIFGDFNNWKTAVSTVPNKFEPSSGNPDTWYTKTLVPITYFNSATHKYRYKYVLNYGTLPDGNDDYVYIEDPRSELKSDDGFGGFNSYFKVDPSTFH